MKSKCLFSSCTPFHTSTHCVKVRHVYWLYYTVPFFYLWIDTVIKACHWVVSVFIIFAFNYNLLACKCINTFFILKTEYSASVRMLLPISHLWQRATSKGIIRFGCSLQQVRVQIEHISWVGFAASWTMQL